MEKQEEYIQGDALMDEIEEAKKLWATGQLVPDRITYALDSRDLYGPEVDLACEAEEPEVDLWEVGLLYPKWNQFVALAKLTRTPMACFFQPFSRINNIHICGRGGVKMSRDILEDQDKRIERFTDEALRECEGVRKLLVHDENGYTEQQRKEILEAAKTILGENVNPAIKRLIDQHLTVEG